MVLPITQDRSSHPAHLADGSGNMPVPADEKTHVPRPQRRPLWESTPTRLLHPFARPWRRGLAQESSNQFLIGFLATHFG